MIRTLGRGIINIGNWFMNTTRIFFSSIGLLMLISVCIINVGPTLISLAIILIILIVVFRFKYISMKGNKL